MNLKDKTRQFIEECLDLMFPVRLGVRELPRTDLKFLEYKLLNILDSNFESTNVKSQEIVNAFSASFNSLRTELNKDISAIYDGDPAANSKSEIILAYPGFHAIACYRIAHHLLKDGVTLIPRIITEYAHSTTGIDIHPGAKIGDYFCIDHGTGVVIGETTIIGTGVKIYQGVTLGALSIPDRSACPKKRHPTIGDNVVIYAQAIILGGDTVIGENSVIGGNVWITKSIAPNSKIYFDSSHTIIN